MRVLFYAYPGLMSQGPHFTDGHATILARMMAGLVEAREVACHLVAPSRSAPAVQRVAPSLRNVAYVDDVDLHRRIAGLDANSAVPTVLCRQARSREATTYPAVQVLMQYIARACGDFAPDVVITFSMQADYLGALWPAVTVFHCEATGFSRSPFPFSLFFDHMGTYDRAATAVLVENDLEVSSGALALAHQVRDDARAAFESADPFRELDIGSGFSKTVLLPLGVSNFYSFDDFVPYRSQFEVLFDVLRAAPRDVAIVVTEYNDWGQVLHRTGPAANERWLRSSFPNLIFHETFRHYSTPSPYLLRYVHGAISVVSNVGLQALLLGLRLGCTKQSPLRMVAHDVGFDQFFSSIAGTDPPPDRSRWLAWYLERYAVPATVFNDGHAFSDYLQRRIQDLSEEKVANRFSAVAPISVLHGHWAFRADASGAAKQVSY